MKYSFLSILLSFIIVFLPSDVSAQSAYPIYVIQPGDSLGSIAEQFDVPLNDLLSVNGILDPDFISPGQELLIPGMGDIQGELSFHAIQLAETLRDIQVQYQLDQDWIARHNNLTSPTQVFAGTELLTVTSSRSTSFTPVGQLKSPTSIIDVAVKNYTNPYYLLLVNQKKDHYHFLSGEHIFLGNPPDSGIETGLFPGISEISISPLPMVQGSTEVITIRSDDPLEISGTLNGKTLNFYSDSSGAFYAIQGIHAMAEPGLSDLSLTINNPNSESISFSQDVLLLPGVFDYEELTVDPSLIDPTVTEPEIELVNDLVSVSTTMRYWDGQFQSPAVYQYFNSLFGTRREYNENGVITFHTGVDYGGGITLPIYAPAAGKVVFAGPLTVRGNTVFIDHGWGIYSGFFHQNKILVSVGDIVTQGQQIGEVGNTGRIDGTDNYYGAGAHQHWEVWANGVQVDPLSWLSAIYP